MSDSTENTNELDSYGVWVKNTKQDEPADDLNFTDSLDLPDFEESTDLDEADFSDMFTEDDTLNLDSSADDTTLTDDELLNITNGDGIEIAEETFAEPDQSLDDISFDSLEENSVSDADLSDFITEEPAPQAADDMSELNIPDVSIEDPSESADAPADETTLDDFSFDEITDTGDTAPETTEEEVTEEFGAQESFDEEVSAEDFGVEEASGDGEEEISLDDFMDEGFSDESVASGNNGFAADAAPAAGDSEEVSLDDFVDMSEFGVTEDAPKKDEAIVDEKPLDMDISFDSSADTIQTEENLEDNNILSEDFDDTEETEVETEVVEEEEIKESTGSNDIEAEEVDLSDFGIDADAEETPVTQDIESSKLKDTVVDYDLSVDNDHMSAAPVVNEIKSTANTQTDAELEEIPEETDKNEISQADSGLLQQIVADLSNLKAEINSLKTNLEEMKSAPVAAPAEASGITGEEIAVEEEVIDDSADNADTGFFSGDDGDDTIALSTDELSNILNTADFNSEEEVVAQEPAEEAFEETAVEEQVVEEETAEEPVVEEMVVEESPADDISIEDNFLSSDGPLDEGIIADEIAADNFEVPAEKASDLTYDFTDENLSEPNLDDIEIDEDTLEDDLPDEISIPKEDNILVESSSSDFMESVQDTTEEHAAEEPVVEEAPVEEPVVEETVIEEPVADEPAFSTVDNLFDESNGFADIAGESAEETIVEEEPVFEEEQVVEEEPLAETEPEPEPEPEIEENFDVVEEEPVIEEETFVPEEEVMAQTDDTVIPEPELENDFVSHEDDNNNLTDSNIDYLTTEDKDTQVEADENAELKKDIKSVLLYMDQLLENLPEEKIVEFAKSDEFTTYKKLFSELGLS